MMAKQRTPKEPSRTIKETKNLYEKTGMEWHCVFQVLQNTATRSKYLCTGLASAIEVTYEYSVSKIDFSGGYSSLKSGYFSSSIH